MWNFLPQGWDSYWDSCLSRIDGENPVWTQQQGRQVISRPLKQDGRGFQPSTQGSAYEVPKVPLGQ